MYIYHNSHDKLYRYPFGAVKTGETVNLGIDAADCGNVTEVTLRLWINDSAKYLKMEHCGTGRFGDHYFVSFEVPDTPCLVWYNFIIAADGGTYYYSNNGGMLGGEGELTASPEERSYQITVYKKDFKTPDKFKNSIMYQIFPDRFYRDKEIGDIPKKRSEYTIHEEWYEPISNNRHPYENGPAYNDFYGGSLKGIEAKLDYLQELGISTIYLNPIFEAYSNHRYDTGNYENIDPILGTEEDFAELCAEAASRGIGIILDGVFSHTGSDSIYFNKYGNYGEGSGAYRDKGSPYARWYKWTDGGYESWWGCSNLPNINETEPTYIDYILSGGNAIIKKWIRLGASGWRLDVADELPDEFIKTLRKSVKEESEDAVIIGEVWEDATNKVSYGEKREYLFGEELDSVMNYPFKDGVTDFLMGYIGAETFDARMTAIAENYPKESLYAAMNIIGTHDTARIKTVLGGGLSKETDGGTEGGDIRLSPHEETLAADRVRLAAFIQMTYVGVPCIYYGDEIGMQGGRDPYNRMPYTWRCIDPETLEYYKRLCRLRNESPCLRTGELVRLYAEGDVYVYAREITDGTDALGEEAEDGLVICAVNRGEETAVLELNAALCRTELSKLVGVNGGGEIKVKNGVFKLEIGARAADAYITYKSYRRMFVRRVK